MSSTTTMLNDVAKKHTKKTIQAAQKLKKKAKDFQSPLATIERFTNLTMRKDKRSTTMPTPASEKLPEVPPKQKLQRSNSANSLRRKATMMMKNAITPKSSEKKVYETSSAPSMMQTLPTDSRDRSDTQYQAIPSKELFTLTHAPFSHNNNNTHDATVHPTYGSIFLPSSGECGSIQVPIRAVDDSCIGNVHYQSIPDRLSTSKYTPPTPKRTPRVPKVEVAYGCLPSELSKSQPSSSSSASSSYGTIPKQVNPSSASSSYGTIPAPLTQSTSSASSSYGSIPAPLTSSTPSSASSSYGTLPNLAKAQSRDASYASLPSFAQSTQNKELHSSSKKKGKLSSDSEEEEVRERIQVISHKLNLWLEDHESGNDATSLDDIAQAVWELEVLGRLLNVDTSRVRASSRDLIQIRKQPLSSLPTEQLEEKRKNLEEMLQKLREDL